MAKKRRDDRTDSQLIADYCSGDEAAFTELYLRYIRLITAIVSPILVRYPDTVDDVLQLTMMQVSVGFRKGGYDSSKGSCGTWIGTIARTRAVDMYRKMRKPKHGGLITQYMAEDALYSVELRSVADLSATSSVAIIEARHDIALFIAQLPPVYRNVALLLLQQPSYEEMQEMLQVPLSTVKTRIRVTRSLMKKEASKEAYR